MPTQVLYTPSAAPDIAVEDPEGTDLVDGSASIDCGVINLAGPSSLVTFTVKNTGAANLTGLALTKDGSHSADFTLGSLGATTLAPGASTTFDVTFLPGAEGVRTAALHIASNDANENPFDIALTGTGITVGTLVVTPPGNFTSSGSFGGTPFPSTRQYTLNNPGNTPINWTAAKTAPWVDLSASNGTLAAGANTTVTVSINSNAGSLAIGGYNDTVTFANTTNGNGNTTRGVSLTVNPISAVVTIGNLSQTYDGSPKSASVTIDPPGLEYSVTYDTEANPPTNAGTYTVVATITEPNYAGGDSKDLIIAKAPQTIDFAALDPVYANASPFTLTATANSGLAVSFTSSNPAVATVSGSTVTVIGLGTTTITASQAGNANFNPASVPQTLAVVRIDPLAVTGGPYNVLFGQSLSLNGTASEPSYSETISAYEWDLNNDNTFGDVTGAIPPAISYNSLITTWGRVSGVNTIQLKITDSAGKTSITATTLTLITTLTWDANGTTSAQTNGAGAWLGNNLWWNGTSNLNWVSGSNAVIGGPNTAGGAVTLASPTAVNLLTLNTFTGTYTLGTALNTITLNGGTSGFSENGNTGMALTLNNSASFEVQWGSALFNPSTFVLQASTAQSSSNITFANKLDLNGADRTISVSGGTTGAARAIISGQIRNSTGTAGLIKTGAGVLNITSAASAWNGTTSIQGGILDFAAMTNANIGGGSGRNITVAAGVGVRFDALNNTLLNRIVETSNEITVMTATTANSFTFGSSTGANLPNAFLGNWASNGAKCEISGTITPGIDSYRLGGKGSRNLLSVFTNAGGNNESNLAATAVTGFTLNVGSGNTCTYSGTIADFAPATTITKTGPGTEVLSGANTYTGATYLNDGRLSINGSLSNLAAALNVAGGATLGGTGTIGRDVAIADGGKLEFNISTAAASHDRLDISAGRSFAFSGASVLTINSSNGAVPGTYTLITGGNNITGTAPATVNLPDGWLATVSISGNSLLLDVTSTVGDNTPPTLVSINDDKSGGPVPVNTPVTYTVTFSEDMDASTVTPADFGNVGTAPVTIGTVVETLPGVFTVQATPTGTGTLQLQIPVTAVLKDVAGNALDNDPALADDTVIFVNSAFDSWTHGTFTNGTLSDKNAALDFDGGGLATAIEWVVGGDPTTGNDDAAKAPTCDITTDPAYLTYTYRRSDAANTAPKTAIQVEYGSDLSDWTTAVAGPDIIITESDNFYGTSPGIDKVEVKIKRNPANHRLFTRLNVAITP